MVHFILTMSWYLILSRCPGSSVNSWDLMRNSKLKKVSDVNYWSPFIPRKLLYKPRTNHFENQVKFGVSQFVILPHIPCFWSSVFLKLIDRWNCNIRWMNLRRSSSSSKSNVWSVALLLPGSKKSVQRQRASALLRETPSHHKLMQTLLPWVYLVVTNFLLI